MADDVYALLSAALDAYAVQVNMGRAGVGRPVSGLYPRYIEAIYFTALGFTVKEVACKMGISTSTVSSYLTDSRRIMGAKNVAHLVYLSVKAGLLR